MGWEVNAICLDCKRVFTVRQGGGFLFHQLRCAKCGKDINVCMKDVGTPYLQYVKGMSEHNRRDPFLDVDVNALMESSLEPISFDDFIIEVEKYAGQCKCGGNYLFHAPARCPSCKSTNIEESEEVLMYYD